MQKSFSDLEYAAKKKLTRRDRFLAEIDKRDAVGAICIKLIEPFYPKVEGAAAADRTGADAAHVRGPAVLWTVGRRYRGRDLRQPGDPWLCRHRPDRESAPDATTLLKFRRLLEANELTRKIFDTINGHLAEKGLMMREGTIVDATLIAAPPSTKNKDGKRDPEMHQSKKGNDWHFGMKAHIGVDVASGLVHTVVGTAGNVADVTQAHALLHGDEMRRSAMPAIRAWKNAPENHRKSVTWHVAMKRSKRKALPENKLGRRLEKLEHLKASVRAKVEHPFHVVKNLFRHRKIALSRPGQEHRPAVHPVRLRQSGAGRQAFYDNRIPSAS